MIEPRNVQKTSSDRNKQPQQTNTMNRIIRKNSMLVCALLGVMLAGQAMAVDLRYQGPGADWTNTVAVDGFGWRAGGGGPNGLPGTTDTARLNWGRPNGITVTLSSVAPLIQRFQFGVDESGNLVVNAGGLLTTRESSYIGNNNILCNASVTVNTGGEVSVTNILYVGHGTVGALTNDGGKVSCTSHLWTGSQATGVGTIVLTNGGSLKVGGNIGLGTVNASSASGGKCSLYVRDGGLLSLNQMNSVTTGTGGSIQSGSVLDISGSGVVTLPGDYVSIISGFTNVSRITAYAGLGTVGIDYNNTNVGKTTLWAIAPAVPPPTNTVWNPAGNPSGTGKWNEKANWTGGVAPAGVTKVNFNVVGAIPCTVTNMAVADYVVMGENGPGGTLVVTNGGSLTCGAVSASTIGLNSNAVLVVENGGSVSFGTGLWIGSDMDSDGTLTMNGGTVSVAGMFNLGSWGGGKGTAQIKGGTLNLAQWGYLDSMQGNSLLEVSGTGRVIINGDQTGSVNYYISAGQITNHAGPDTLVVDYNNINVGKTTIYPLGIYIPPAQVTWNPALNLLDTDGLWNNFTNWSSGVGPSNVTIVTFKITDAIPCTVTNAAFASAVRIGNGGPGGTLIITNGGSLTSSSADEWNSIGMNNTGLMVVENGGSASFGQHLWIGYSATADGTLLMNGGTVSVAGMFGLGWTGGKGTANINGGTLNLSQWSASSPGSIAGTSVLAVAGTGKVVITGNYSDSVSNYVSLGKITANGGPNVFYSYDPAVNKTTISAVLLPAPKQSITAVSVSGGSVTLTYQTTHQHTYHIESTPSLSPASWAPVAGSTNAATGVPVTFTFPVSGSQRFYRTVSYP
jgi:hypothetical protein